MIVKRRGDRTEMMQRLPNIITHQPSIIPSTGTQLSKKNEDVLKRNDKFSRKGILKNSKNIKRSIIWFTSMYLEIMDHFLEESCSRNITV